MVTVTTNSDHLRPIVSSYLLLYDVEKARAPQIFPPFVMLEARPTAKWGSDDLSEEEVHHIAMHLIRSLCLPAPLSLSFEQATHRIELSRSPW